MTVTTPPTVELTGLGKRFRTTRALDAVDLTLSPGVTGLLGPNGAGKTTLLRILATVISADTGRARILGRDPAEPDQRTEIRRRLGYQPQELGFPRGFTAAQFVDYLAILKEWSVRAERHAEVLRALDAVGLGDLATRRVSRLSGGQRRRVALAQALLGRPELLVLDEPTTGLDPEQRASLRQVLAGLGEAGTLVVSTHQTEDVAALCRRVVVLDRGRVHFDGTVPELVALARGRVWLAAEPDPRALTSYRTATGRHRCVGHRLPPGAEPVDPTLEDAYLLLRSGLDVAEAVAS
jgi:ABC-2 type transport system ATP-binding protein